MPVLTLAAFAVFFICCGAQFWFVRRVRIALIDRHPELWLSLSRGRHMFDLYPEFGFAWRRGDKDLGDPQLSRAVQDFRRLYIVAIAAWLAMASTMFLRH